jgi:hypothetical protein
MGEIRVNNLSKGEDLGYESISSHICMYRHLTKTYGEIKVQCINEKDAHVCWRAITKMAGHVGDIACVYPFSTLNVCHSLSICGSKFMYPDVHKKLPHVNMRKMHTQYREKLQSDD